jgi:hypothetical protein
MFSPNMPEMIDYRKRQTFNPYGSGKTGMQQSLPSPSYNGLGPAPFSGGQLGPGANFMGGAFGSPVNQMPIHPALLQAMNQGMGNY